MLVQYIRGRGKLVGTLVAIPTEDGFSVGWSRCRKGDKFSKQDGQGIAYDRAKGISDYVPVPHSLQKQFIAMYNRAQRYFKA